MSYITPQQAAHQLVVTAPTFTDTAQRLTYTAGTGDYGYGAPTYPAGASFACSFQDNHARDAQAETAVPMADANLYCAQDVTLEPADRVKITHLYGIAMTVPQSYQIVGGPFIHHNVKHALLKLVTDGSS